MHLGPARPRRRSLWHVALTKAHTESVQNLRSRPIIMWPGALEATREVDVFWIYKDQ